MTFQQLTYLVEVSKCGSINKAAQNLYLSQTAISASIRALEDEFHLKFINRSNRGIEFTQIGKEFVSYAVSLLEQRDRMESLYKHTAQTESFLRFSVTSQRFLFPEDAFIRLLKMNGDKNFTFSYHEANMNTVIDDIAEHRSDVGVISVFDSNKPLVDRLLATHGLEFHPLVSSPPCIFCRKGHPLTELEKITEQDLDKYIYLYYDQGLGTAVEFSEEYQWFPIRKPRRAVCSNSRAVIVNMMLLADAFTVGSGLLLDQISPRLTSVPLTKENAIQIGWIKDSRQSLSDGAKQFVSLLQDAAGRTHIAVHTR